MYSLELHFEREHGGEKLGYEDRVYIDALVKFLLLLVYVASERWTMLSWCCNCQACLLILIVGSYTHF